MTDTELITADPTSGFRVPRHFDIEYETLHLHFLFDEKPFDFAIENRDIITNSSTVLTVSRTLVPEQAIERWALDNQLLLREYKAAVAEIDGFLDEHVKIAVKGGARTAKRREMVTRVMQSLTSSDSEAA